MTRMILAVLLIALLAVGGYFAINYQVETRYDNGKVSEVKITPRAAGSDAAQAETSRPNPLPAPPRPTFRIATFDLGGLDENKLGSLRISDVLVRLLPRFELIALEGIRGKNQGVLVPLVEEMNSASGRQYSFATCPTQRRDGVEHYSAFVFDRTALEVDHSTVHFVEDPMGRFRHKPLVGAFRVRGIDPALAFTFILIAVDADPDKPDAELDLLADVDSRRAQKIAG